MVNSRVITKYCQDYLKTEDFDDYCHNGCQVEGVEEIQKVITGVSLSKQLIDVAIKKKAQMIIVHHGFFVGAFGRQAEIRGVARGRLKALLENNINLLGFHLPLDAHPEIGNNISICKALDIGRTEKFEVGFIGELENDMDFDKFLAKVNKLFKSNSYSLKAGRDKVKKVAVVSGSAYRRFERAKEVGADTYLSGDIGEETVRAVEEAKTNFINAGHYNTEKMGVQNLGKLIAEKFGLEVEFVDISNEI